MLCAGDWMIHICTYVRTYVAAGYSYVIITHPIHRHQTGISFD